MIDDLIDEAVTEMQKMMDSNKKAAAAIVKEEKTVEAVAGEVLKQIEEESRLMKEGDM